MNFMSCCHIHKSFDFDREIDETLGFAHAGIQHTGPLRECCHEIWGWEQSFILFIL